MDNGHDRMQTTPHACAYQRLEHFPQLTDGFVREVLGNHVEHDAVQLGHLRKALEAVEHHAAQWAVGQGLVLGDPWVLQGLVDGHTRLHVAIQQPAEGVPC